MDVFSIVTVGFGVMRQSGFLWAVKHSKKELTPQETEPAWCLSRNLFHIAVTFDM